MQAKILSPGALLLAAFLPAAALAGEKSVHLQGEGMRRERFLAGERPLIEVDNLYGAVEVVGGASDEVVIEARISGGREGAKGSFQVEIARTDTGVVAKAACKSARDQFAWCGKQRVDFVIRAPAFASLALRGVATDLSVASVRGKVMLSTVTGSVDVRDVGPLIATSELGVVRVENAESAEISAGEGQLELVGMHRHARARRSLVARGAEAILHTLLGAIIATSRELRG